ncbi:TPA: oligopeptide transporter, OPT family [Neisseria meningitidis]|uniref:Putative metal-nicotianamine transporter YSL7 Protein YELLOW STRIPE LIKE 7 AtYSL7 n=2 Tax=Neisseria meningitidis TaxID=487 RepID=I4E2P8_NEIME|nr:oligopeptide transporter, OPT family [Neisseria meningitidis]CCA43610.1 putative metal-nicotianamine transporter YSL7 Protein YELLOW STRIPE LIKE 7; AtYSL7 [Neisseria meningitidis alpha522]MBG8715712.1 oligopeptide transporter, OPT family [Neisseria meningitidis]MBJ1809947.1 oligopeptide transporter, OPT family [Neisseria meningitidis]MCL5941821.1 oligopeptide transporter, OPT family [Neisseria meningitidis]MCL6109174.1 oligopeptide transporter, OPT family [Neisseria meningitidis]
MNKSLSGSVEEYRELTLRGMILGALITVIFTASNVYLGLKVGLTFASSIPAAVISMAVLKFFKGSNILENNMVQTQASAAGTLSTIIFVLPGLLMAGYWSGFPFWQTTLLCIAGGILGVIFTIPLRYAMVVKSDLPYPEGVAAAEILKVGGHEEGDDRQGGSGIKELAAGGALAGLMSFCAGGLRVIADSASYWFKSGTAIFQLPMGFSLALLGAGYLVGLTGGIAILLGISIAWGIAVPYFSSHIPQPSDMEMAAFAMKLWKEKVRFIGAGTIGIAAVWTLLMLLKPMVEGMKMSFKSFGGGAPATERAEQDLSPKAMIFWVLSMMFILGVSFYHFIGDSHITGGMAWLLVVVCTLLASVIGFLVAAACGYMAGLVGSSSSPISGVGIVSVVVISLVLLLVGESGGLLADEANRKFLLALTLFCGSAVICVASISNDNLQDLKTGYLLKATPWRQQVALIIGCIVGALVISPVLELLYEAYGFTGAMPREGMDAAQALAAPQATLMTTIASGIFAHNLEWVYIFTGIAIGAVLIAADLVLKKSSGGKLALPVLAVGMGIYLPPSVNMPIVAGAVLAAVLKHIIGKKAENREGRLKNAERIGTLFSAGLIVGESLIGVIMAFIIAFSVTNGGSDAPLALNLQNWDAAASWLGLAFFVTGMIIFARRVLKAGR